MKPGNRILVVEDDPNLAEVMNLHLSAQRLAVTVVDDGLDALQVFDSDPPALVTLDLNISTISGFRLINLFKRFRPHVPILVVTAMDFAEVEEVARAGVDDFITKPFDPDVLIRKVRYHLQRGHQSETQTVSEPAERESRGVTWGRVALTV